MTPTNTARRLAPVALVLALVAALCAAVVAAASTAPVPVPDCVKPTGTISNAKLLAYVECRSDRLEALIANSAAPAEPTPTDPSPTPTDPTPTDPTPTPTDPPPSGFPNAANTGVPSTVTLAPYDGPCIFRETHGSSVVIDGQDVRAKCSELLSYHPFAFTIRNSIVPRIETTTAGSSVTITDSEVRAPGWQGGALWGSNITATRVEVTGGQHSVHCEDNCTVVDSWLHDQWNPDGGSSHNNAFLSNGGKNYELRGNTLHCDAILNSTDGGCTSDLSLIGDWAPIDNVLVQGNLFKANNSSAAYCTNAGTNPGKPFPTATNVRYVDNVFERGANGKCGVYGPVTSFDGSATGNEWTGNRWDSGELLVP